MSMRPELKALLEHLRDVFVGVEFNDVNDTDVDGGNALHWAARQNNLAGARLLIEAGMVRADGIRTIPTGDVRERDPR